MRENRADCDAESGVFCWNSALLPLSGSWKANSVPRRIAEPAGQHTLHTWGNPPTRTWSATDGATRASSLALRVSVYKISLAAPAAAELASVQTRGDRLNSGEW